MKTRLSTCALGKEVAIAVLCLSALLVLMCNRSPAMAQSIRRRLRRLARRYWETTDWAEGSRLLNAEVSRPHFSCPTKMARCPSIPPFCRATALSDLRSTCVGAES